MQQRDSLSYTIRVAAILCVVCSLAVSTAAVVLQPYQEANEKLNQQKNILDATGLAKGEYGKSAGELSRDQIDTLYSWISEELITLKTGEVNTELDINTYNPLLAVQKSESRTDSDPEAEDYTPPPPGEPYRELVAKVYYVKRPGEAETRQVVLPVYGKGLWGTLRGYLAVRRDLETVQGLTFYQHKETPGLGGEVDNPGWKAQWPGRKLFSPDGTPSALVFKGPAPSDNPYAVDGLSGATITSRGVTNLINYWTGEDGYGPFLKNLKVRLEDETSSTTDGGA